MEENKCLCQDKKPQFIGCLQNPDGTLDEKTSLWLMNNGRLEVNGGSGHFEVLIHHCPFCGRKLAPHISDEK